VFDEDAAEASRVDPQGWVPQLYRDDGAQTNW
jgi:hypothetical protein